MDLFLTLLSAILTAAIAFLPFLGDVTKTTPTGVRELTAKGRAVLAMTIVGIAVIWLQKQNSDAESQSKERKSKVTLDSSLAVMQMKFDSSLNLSNKTIVGAQADALGKYGYKYDSVQRLLVKIVRDSSKTTIIKGLEPSLSLCVDRGITLENQQNTRYDFAIKFCSLGAGSANFKMPAYYVIEDSLGNLSYRFKSAILAESSRIGPNQWASTSFHITLRSEQSGIKYLFVYVKGSYTNMDKSKIFPVNNLYLLQLEDKQFGDVVGSSREKVLNYLKAMNIIN